MLLTIGFSVILLSAWEFPGVHSFCNQFPYGHTCRNIDLTAFCLQVSQLIKIRNSETPVRPYYQFEKIFDRLQTSVKADTPFVHFGGYKQPKNWFCIEKKCTESATPTSDASGATASPCPPPSPCHFVQGPASDEETTKPDYKGCDKDCSCCKEPPKEDLATGTIFSLQDGCELKYLKSPLEKNGQVINRIKADSNAKENPYTLTLSEISVNKVRLHNWLHVKISSSGANPFGSGSELGSGNIKMAFIIAHDALGFPVGEFVSTLPCGSQCNCEERNTPHVKVCHQASFQDHIPCMFDSRRVISNTGMLMVYAEDDTRGKGLKEIHASWRFSQSASPDNFITELHFRALVVDDFDTVKMLVQDSDNSRLSGMSERPMTKEGVFGWNPMYTILHPSRNTIGGWDYFREDVFTQKDVNCHQPISTSHYTQEPYPSSGQRIRKVNTGTAAKEHCYRLNDSFQSNPPLENINYCFPTGNTGVHERSPVRCPGVRTRVEPWFIDTYGFTSAGKVDQAQVYPWTLYGGRTEAYVIRDGGLDKDDWRIYNDKPANIKLYWGLEPEGSENELDYAECEGSPQNKYGAARNHQYPTRSQAYDIQGKYGHFCTAEGTGRRVLNLPAPTDKWPNTLATIWKFPAVAGGSYDDDRCYCPKLLATPDPRFREPPEVQVQGRRQHAYQMIISWNCIVPFGCFVSRYYKETYSKVFFLQEYWWYTIHVLCMVSSAMFTFGGIYVMELKRVDPINWEDNNITAHIVIGFLVILLFGFQVCSGFFRIRNVRQRVFNIFMHWCLGIVEYTMALACMINSSFILLSGMTCSGVVALGLLVVVQIMFYASMEVHMRNVDKILKLKPPRSYLPPPVMRVFHKDAPDAKFRIYVLIAYFFLCMCSALVQFITMDTNELGESCFLKSGRYSEDYDY